MSWNIPVPEPVTGWWPLLYTDFALSVAPHIEMFAGTRAPADIGLHVPPALAMSGSGISASSFGLHVAPAITLERRPPVGADLAIPVPITMGFVGGERYPRGFGLAVPPSLAVGGRGLTPAAFALPVPASVRFAGALPLKSFSDDFNRPDDATGLGPNWTARAFIMGIRNYQAYGVTSIATQTAIASWVAPLGTDNQRVSARVFNVSAAASNAMVYLFIASQVCFRIIRTGTGATYGILWGANPFTVTTVGVTLTNQPLPADGDVLSIERAPESTVFVVKRNGVTVTSWDGAGAVSKDPANRFVGIGSTGLTPMNWDDWTAEDI